MIVEHSDQAIALALAAIGAYEQNARTAMRWVHKSWLARALSLTEDAAHELTNFIQTTTGADESPHAGRLDALEECSLALLQVLKIQIPSVVSLSSPGVAHFDAMPPQLGLCVLRMRALRFRRSELRRVVDKNSRLRLSAWIGSSLEQIIEMNRTTQLTSEAPDTDTLVLGGMLPPLETLNAEDLALEGYALIERDLRMACSPCPLLRIVLPSESRRFGKELSRYWLHAIPESLDADGTTWMLEKLAVLVPECAWLFG